MEQKFLQEVGELLVDEFSNFRLVKGDPFFENMIRKKSGGKIFFFLLINRCNDAASSFSGDRKMG